MNLLAKNIGVILVVLLLVNQSFAQKNYNFNEGVIKYKVETEGAGEYAGILSSTVFDVYIKNGSSKIDIGVMGGLLSLQVINNIEKELQTVLMDIPSVVEKTAIDLDGIEEAMKELDGTAGVNQAPRKNDVSITYNKGRKKRIAKYNCYQAEVKMSGTDEIMTVYLTDKIRSKALKEFQKVFSEIEGFPLEFTMTVQGVKLRLTAEEVVRQQLESTIFEVPSNYTTKTVDDFKKEMEQQFSEEGGKGVKGL